MKKLNLNEIALLKTCLQKKKISFDYYEDINHLSKEQYNQLRDIVCDELIKKGFSINGEINDYGKKLENLIDSLGRFFL